MEYHVGYNRQIVNPDAPIPLGGFSNEDVRFHTAITEDICITCLAVSDGTTTVLAISADLCTLRDQFCHKYREAVARVTGLPEERIFIAATHTHSGPVLYRDKYESVRDYYVKFQKHLEIAAVEALRDLKPAKLFVGSLETENLNFVKHYKMRDKVTGEISCIGDCYGTEKGKIYVDHMTKTDPTLHVVRFQREGGKDVVLANFRAHPHFTGGAKKYDLSSDYIGAFRMALEAMCDCHAVYFQGASGNINSSSRLTGERRYTTCRSYGTALAASALECLGRCMKEVTPAPIQTKQVTFYGQINHSQDHLAEEGKRIWELWQQTYDRELVQRECDAAGFTSRFHANAAYTRSKMTPEDGELILNAVSLGKELAFVTYPGELFDSLSARMEATSPFYTTLFFGYCYHHRFYLPSMEAFKYGSYEVDTTRFQPGTGEMVADTFVEMLKELKGKAT